MKGLVFAALCAVAAGVLLPTTPAIAEAKYCSVPGNVQACLSSAAESAEEIGRAVEDPGSTIEKIGGQGDRAACTWIENDIAYGTSFGYIAPWIDSAVVCQGAVAITLDNQIYGQLGTNSAGAGHWNCASSICALSTQASPGFGNLTSCWGGHAIAEPVPGTFEVSFAPSACYG